MILNLTASSPSLVFSANDLIRLAMHCFAVRHKQVPLPTPKKTAKLQVAQILLPTFFYMVVEHTNFEKPTVNTCFISCDVERHIYIYMHMYILCAIWTLLGTTKRLQLRTNRWVCPLHAVYPSFPHASIACLNSWIARASKTNIEHILVGDFNPPEKY